MPGGKGDLRADVLCLNCAQTALLSTARISHPAHTAVILRFWLHDFSFVHIFHTFVYNLSLQPFHIHNVTGKINQPDS